MSRLATATSTETPTAQSHLQSKADTHEEPGPLWISVLVALLCGITLAWPFRDLDSSFPAWLALAPIFRIAVFSKTRSRVFICSMAFSLTWTWLSFDFLWNQTPPGAIALCMYTSLVYSLGLLLIRRFARKLVEHGRIFKAVFAVAAIWSLVEIARSCIPILQFPWLLLGHTLLYNDHVRQGADLMGVYGLSFLIAATNAAFAFAIPVIREKRCARISVGIVAAAMAALYIYGEIRIAQIAPLLKPGRLIGVVQGNTVQKLGRSAEELTAQLQEHLNLHRELAEKTKASSEDTAAFICWAETMVPGIINEDGWGRAFKAGVAASGIPTLTGVNYQMARDPAKPEEIRYQNGCMLFDANGHELFHYCKRRLVPFGEYVPFAQFPIFNLIRSVTRDQYVPGTEASPVYKIGGYAIALNICVEDIHADLAREAAWNGADTLINVTNDGWFYRTYGPRSHLQAAAWRSIEVRRPMLRVTNTGRTVSVNPLGEIDNIIPEATKGTCLCSILRIMEGPTAAQPKTLTMYLGEGGDAVIFGMILVLCVWPLRSVKVEKIA